MATITFRFPTGRYHATPWGRHVNEADVEWPPSPWRILRALIATWHRKVEPQEFSEALLESLVHKLASTLPVYRLPSAIRSHSRHYMPVRSGKSEKKALIFDAFVRVAPEEHVTIHWPDTELTDDESGLLVELLGNINFLGRAESWVEAEMSDEQVIEFNCFSSEISVDPKTGEAYEPTRLIAPAHPNEYQAWRDQTVTDHGLNAGKLKKSEKQLLSTLPERLIDALRLETGSIQQAGWSAPPGSRFVTYQRPYGCFTPQPHRKMNTAARKTPMTTARLALAGKPLPRIEDAVRIGELVRVAAMSKAQRTGTDDSVPPALSGHDLGSDNRHGHAFYLPEDSTGDGHIDHVLIHADIGLNAEALAALNGINKLWEDGSEWQVMLEQYGSLNEIRGSAYIGPATTWQSITPYLHPWFAKKNFTVEAQILRECRERCLPEPEIEMIEEVSVRKGGRKRRPVHFRRFRRRRGLTQPDTRGSFWKLTFPEPIDGPLALGFGCHFGLGLFARRDEN